jgi:hypothetical protein
VPAGVVVVQLGRRRQAGEHLELRELELTGRAPRVGDILDLGEALGHLLMVVADRRHGDGRLDHAPAGAQVAALEPLGAGRRADRRSARSSRSPPVSRRALLRGRIDSTESSSCCDRITRLAARPALTRRYYGPALRRNCP